MTCFSRLKVLQCFNTLQIIEIKMKFKTMSFDFEEQFNLRINSKHLIEGNT
jgi:hypothetical protein